MLSGILANTFPLRFTILSEDKQEMTPGKNERFLQFIKLRVSRPDKPSNDNGNCSIAVPSNLSIHKDVIFPTIAGNVLRLEQPDRSKNSRDSKLIKFGRLLRRLQFRKFNRLRHLRNPMDGWTLDKLVQPSSSSLSRLGTPVKSGVSIKF
jgi:hypothetical protein